MKKIMKLGHKEMRRLMINILSKINQENKNN